jgi:hypothetical protein
MATGTRTTFVVRQDRNDPKSETIARGANYNGTYDAAMTVLMDDDRDYVLFYILEIDSRGRVTKDWGTVSWEPQG